MLFVTTGQQLGTVPATGTALVCTSLHILRRIRRGRHDARGLLFCHRPTQRAGQRLSSQRPRRPGSEDLASVHRCVLQSLLRVRQLRAVGKPAALQIKCSKSSCGRTPPPRLPRTRVADSPDGRTGCPASHPFTPNWSGRRRVATSRWRNGSAIGRDQRRRPLTAL